MRKIEYETFKEALEAMMSFQARGIKCKGIGPHTLEVWDS